MSCRQLINTSILLATAPADLNQGGHFTFVANSPLTTDNPGDGTWPIRETNSGFLSGYAALGDVDTDGDLDVLIPRYSGINGTQPNYDAFSVLYLNDGNAGFTAVTAFEAYQYRAAAADFVDFTGDGKLDLILYGSGLTTRYLVGDGTGAFTPSAKATPTATLAKNLLALADFDNDGDVDLLAHDGTISRWQMWLNDGAGAFSTSAGGGLATSTPVIAGSIGVGDLDGDGDIDLIVGNMNDGSGNVAEHLYWNDGSGSFTLDLSSPISANKFQSPAVTVCDVDNDGDLDILVSGSGTSEARCELHAR